MAQKIQFDSTGTSSSVTVTGRDTVMYYADFVVPGGVGTVQLKIRLGDDTWVPVDEAFTDASPMTIAKAADAPSSQPRTYRWECTAHTSGTITCFLE